MIGRNLFAPARAVRTRSRRTLLSGAALAAAAVLFAGESWSASNTIGGAVTVIEPLSLISGNNLRFGRIALDDNGSLGTVLQQAIGGAPVLSNVVLLPSDRGPASFALTGVAGLNFEITVPAGSILVTGPGDNMSVDDFEIFPVGDGPLDGAGQAAFQVGGKLNVNAGQGQGSYSGNVTVTANYK